MSVRLVPIEAVRIHQAWDDIAPMLTAALQKGHGEIGVDQLRLLCVQGMAEAFGLVVDGALAGAAVIEYLNYPNARIANVIAAGGRGLVDQPQLWGDLKRFLRDERACQQLRGFVQESGARLWRRLGVNELYRVVGVDL